MGAAKRNHETAAGWAYHDATKHSFQSVRDSVHFLDWPNKPLPSKSTRRSTGSSCRANSRRSTCPPSKPYRTGRDYWRGDPRSERPGASALLLSRRHEDQTTTGGEIMFRAAACTGALCEIELYLICGDLPDLEAGVYHFGAHDFSAAVAAGRLSRRDCEGDCGRAERDERACDDHLRGNILAQRMEVSGADLSSLWLGQRHDAREPVGDGYGVESSGAL